LIHDVGYLDSGLNGSLEMLPICDEIIGMVKRFGRGVPVDDDNLAFEAIDRIGPGGNFLSDAHTIKHFRNEFWLPTLMDRSSYEGWLAAGKKSLKERGEEKTNSILQAHQPMPIDELVMKEMKGIVEKADKKAV